MRWITHALFSELTMCPILSRYKSKLIEGAAYYGLTSEYIQWLKSLPSVDDSLESLPQAYYETPSAVIAQVVIVAVAAVVAVALTVYMEAPADK